MKKFLLAALLACSTFIATSVEAGNSIRLKDLNGGGGGGGLALCDPNNCDTDDDNLVWNQTGQCLDCIECTNGQVIVWDTATDTWVCSSAGTNNACPGPAPPAPTDGDILVWDTAAGCYTGLNCADDQMLMYNLGTTSWGCVDAGNLCNAGACADNSLIQWNTATQCYDCITCAADEVVAWDGSDWACVGGPVDPTANGVCIDDTAGDVVVGDDLEVLDDAYIGDTIGVNTCATTKSIGGLSLAAAESHTFHVINSMFSGATSNNSPETNLMLEAHIDSVSAGNVLGFTRFYNIGAGDLPMNWGLEIGRIQWYAWNGTDHQPQASIKVVPDTAFDTGAMANNEAAGTIIFEHGNGTMGSGGTYGTSATARYDLDWEFADDVFIDAGLLGFGSDLEASATCVHDDGSDELFGDRDCDQTMDTAENPLDTYFLEVADGTGATSSFSGLELGGTDWNDIAILQGCSDNEIISWNDGSTIWECDTVAALGAGSFAPNAFSTINASSGTDPVADSATDTLNITGGTDISVTGDSGTDTITIAYTGAAGEANADACYDFSPGQLDAMETNFADLGADTTGTNVRIRYRRFAAATDEYVNGQTVVPDSLASSGNVTITLWTRGDATGCTSNCDVIWSFDYVGRDDAETYDAAYTSSAFATETMTTGNDTTLHEVSQTIATSSFTAGDLLYWRIFRDADNASDNYPGEADILEAQICFAQD